MTKLIKSFGWAMNGIRATWCEEVNFRIEVIVGASVIALGVYFQLLVNEWVIITACIGAVLAAEILNTAIEDLCNKVEPNTDTIIGKVKDIMGGLVLIVCSTSVIVGLLLFSKYF